MTSNNIQVKENFLSDVEYDKVLEYLNNSEWTIQVSNRGDDPSKGFLMSRVKPNKFFYEDLVSKVKNSFGISGNIQEIYFNGQWFGRDGQFHTDGSDKTVLIYISEWRPDWGGFTHLYDNGSHIIFVPIKNNAVCFPGNILHKSYAFSEQFCPMRVTLALKFSK